MKLKRSMRETVTGVDTVAGVEALDAQMESYMKWRAQSRRVADSYRSWKCAPRGERAIAFTRYLTALDREELAAGEYRRTLELVA
jgi:hypothetical protein